tara:strand:- start:2607 stop:3566 length:960 start_codon:yes stop_codon:yes gene_type:complete
MSTNSQDKEIDLGVLFQKITGFFQKSQDAIFDFILFIKRNLILVTFLFVIGAVLGNFLDQNKKYTHEIIVIPNFESVDYLYAKINLLNTKIEEKDSVFLNAIGIQNYTAIKKIEIEPINDIYKFIEQKESNYEVIKLMAEDGDLKKIMESSETSKNYENHLIIITTTDLIKKEKVIKPLLDYLEDSEYFTQVKEEEYKSLKNQIAETEQTIAQINAILNQFSNTTQSNLKSDKLIYYNENNELNEVIITKGNLIYFLSAQKIKLLNYQKIIKEKSLNLNIIIKNGLMKVVMPFLFLFLFFITRALRSFYRAQTHKRSLS